VGRLHIGEGKKRRRRKGVVILIFGWKME